jgi:muconolactone delta-isomerase
MKKVKGFDVTFDFNAIAERVKKDVALEIKKQHKKTVRELQRQTSYWKRPAVFDINDTEDGATISTDDPRYTWVDEGTRPHVIRPRNSRILRWLPGSSVRNEIARRNNMANRQDVAQFTPVVNHPGIRPRHFTDTVMARREKQIDKAISMVLEKAIK